MTNRLLTLLLCLAVLTPQHLCACSVIGHVGPHAPSPHQPGEQPQITTDPCRAHTGRSAGGCEVAGVRAEHPPAACLCDCHSESSGDSSKCPHSVREAVAHAPKSGAGCDTLDLPLAFLSVPGPRSARSARPSRLLSPPGSGHVSLYLMFCSLRN